MITGKNNAVGFTDGNPAGGFQCLCCFVDEKSTETAAFENAVIATDKCGGDDSCGREQIFINKYFQFRGAVAQTADAIAHAFPLTVISLADMSAYLANGFTHAP